MPLWEVAVISKPTDNQKKDGVGERIVLPPTAVIANDEKAAIVAATKGLDVEANRVEVLVRPFSR